MNAKQRHNLLTQIAQQHLKVETLETRHSDSLDFHDVAIWQIQEALEAAFEAGRQAAQTSTTPA